MTKRMSSLLVVLALTGISLIGQSKASIQGVWQGVEVISSFDVALGQSQTSASATGLVTILFSITVKEGREQEAADIMQRLTASSRAEDDGCLTYVFLQQQSSPREYVLYEQWRDAASLNAHLARLRKVFGPAREGGSIPAAILDLFETSRAVRYRVVA
jgi:quinol monooxygenase YgiN